MKEILDNSKLVREGKSISYCIKACILFSAVMLIGSFIYSDLKPENITLTSKILDALILILMPLFIGVMAELSHFVFAKINTRKRKNINDPFWYRIMEATFSVWIVFFVIMVIGL